MITASEQLTPAQIMAWARARAAAQGYVAPVPAPEYQRQRTVPKGKGKDPFGPTQRVLKFARRHGQWTRHDLFRTCPDLDPNTLAGCLCNLETAGKLRVTRRTRADGGHLYSLAPSHRRNGEPAKRRDGDSELRTPKSALA